MSRAVQFVLLGIFVALLVALLSARQGLGAAQPSASAAADAELPSAATEPRRAAPGDAELPSAATEPRRAAPGDAASTTWTPTSGVPKEVELVDTAADEFGQPLEWAAGDAACAARCEARADADAAAVLPRGGRLTCNCLALRAAPSGCVRWSADVLDVGGAPFAPATWARTPPATCAVERVRLELGVDFGGAVRALEFARDDVRHATLRQVKEHVLGATGIPVDEQYAYLGEALLADDARTLGMHGVGDGDTIALRPANAAAPCGGTCDAGAQYCFQSGPSADAWGRTVYEREECRACGGGEGTWAEGCGGTSAGAERFCDRRCPAGEVLAGCGGASGGECVATACAAGEACVRPSPQVACTCKPVTELQCRPPGYQVAVLDDGAAACETCPAHAGMPSYKTDLPLLRRRVHLYYDSGRGEFMYRATSYAAPDNRDEGTLQLAPAPVGYPRTLFRAGDEVDVDFGRGIVYRRGHAPPDAPREPSTAMRLGGIVLDRSALPYVALFTGVPRSSGVEAVTLPAIGNRPLERVYVTTSRGSVNFLNKAHPWPTGGAPVQVHSFVEHSVRDQADPSVFDYAAFGWATGMSAASENAAMDVLLTAYVPSGRFEGATFVSDNATHYITFANRAVPWWCIDCARREAEACPPGMFLAGCGGPHAGFCTSTCFRSADEPCGLCLGYMRGANDARLVNACNATPYCEFVGEQTAVARYDAVLSGDERPLEKRWARGSTTVTRRGRVPVDFAPVQETREARCCANGSTDGQCGIRFYTGTPTVNVRTVDRNEGAIKWTTYHYDRVGEASRVNPRAPHACQRATVDNCGRTNLNMDATQLAEAGLLDYRPPEWPRLLVGAVVYTEHDDCTGAHHTLEFESTARQSLEQEVGGCASVSLYPMSTVVLVGGDGARLRVLKNSSVRRMVVDVRSLGLPAVRRVVVRSVGYATPPSPPA